MSIRNKKYVSFLTAPEHVVDTILRKVEQYNLWREDEEKEVSS